MKDEELDALAKRVRAEWKDDPNVSFVWVGHKMRANYIVEGPTICFAVKRKIVSEDEIRAIGSRPIPREIEGVQTDVVIVSGTFDSDWAAGHRGTNIEDPLKGGVFSSPINPLLSFPTNGGTLGGVCYYKDDRLMAISNAHVWGDELGCEIIQPTVNAIEFLRAITEFFSCGPIIASLAEEVVPSALTTILATAAGAAWIVAMLADLKDPHRRGQEATTPFQKGELTKLESVHLAAQPQSVPLPGMPYTAKLSWEYTRQTDKRAYPFKVEEVCANEHFLVRQQIWADEPIKGRGQKATIFALIETREAVQPDAFHVVAHLTSQSQPQWHVMRILKPAKCDRSPFLSTSLSLGAPDSTANFPFNQNGLVFRAASPGTFRNIWPRGSPDGMIALQFPDNGLRIEVPGPGAAERANIQIIQIDKKPIILEAYDALGNLLDSATTPVQEWSQNILKVHGPGIAYLMLRGGNGTGLLRWVNLKMSLRYSMQPLYPNTHITCYQAGYDIALDFPLGACKALLSVQSVNTAPLDTPPLNAAASPGGVENAILATMESPCTICLALDEIFKVV